MDQGCLFSGEALKEAGQEKVLATCDDVTPGWVDQALELLTLYARHRRTFTADDVRDGAKHLPPPPHHNAWGSVFSKAARMKIIRRCGHAKARHTAAHSRWIGVWCSAGASF